MQDTPFMFKQIFCLSIALILGAGFSQNAVLGKDAVIFSGKKKFLEKWMADGWGGMEAKVVEGAGEDGGAAVSSVFTQESAPWSGISLHLGYEYNGPLESLILDDKLKARGVVELKLNCGKTKDGKQGGDQPLQFGLTFVLKDGTKVSSAPVPMSQLGNAAKLDGNARSWEEVRFSVAEMLKKIPDSSQVAGVWSVNLQYVDTPACEILVGECVLKEK